MKITKTSPLTGKPTTMDLPVTVEQLNRWTVEQGAHSGRAASTF